MPFDPVSVPPVLVTKGRYCARISRAPKDIAAAQTLRGVAFGTKGSDRDAFDDICTHLLVHEVTSGRLVGCLRILWLADGAAILRSYAAQFYDLTALGSFPGPMAEIGRFCSHPDLSDPDILRLAWATLSSYVDENAVEMLFGCSSFPGVETALYQDTFAMLNARHLAPNHWLPGIKAGDVFRFGAQVPRNPDVKTALRLMPPLLRSYLMMGGWVSDHAVIDRQLNTLHVFTGLEIRAIPASRKRLLRAMLG